jgi:hypothetical protein
MQSSGSLPSPSLLFDELDKAFPNFDWKTVVEREVNDPNFEKTDYADNAADALGSSYSEKGALIIRQGPLPTLIVAQLKALSDTVKEKNNGKQEDKTKTSTVQDITIGVTQIADLVKKEPTKPLTKEEVENIRKPQI